ncbi:MAG: FAD:protein FMN transferase [Candidatus Dormibacteraeota bacterium]|nr:FAD:protein FMN transferase [Candidatus Dormibacteraeota bacterium]
MPATSDFRALGTGVRVITLEPETLEAATAAVEQVLREVDLTCSRFRSDSEVTLLNQAAGMPVRVSPLLLQAIDTALRVSRMTGGAVDPTVGAAMRVIGYDRDFARLPADGGSTVAIRPVPGYERIQLDRHASCVMLPPEVEIDLGATAKALAADLCAKAALTSGASGILVSLGGDIAVAGDAPDGGWPILIAEDHAAPASHGGEVIALKAGAVATSSTTVRRWRQGGQARHHIVDPATGAPARVHWRTVSVVAASCVDANAAATASIVWGQAALAWLERNRLAARLVAANADVTRLNRWPRAEVAA